jgi:hypothetical protein
MLKTSLAVFLATLLLFESLLPKAVGIAEAAKIGQLYTHFQEHSQAGLSISEFFWLHYASDSAHKTEKAHKKLPSIETAASFFSFYWPQSEIFVEVRVSRALYNRIGFPSYCNLYVFNFQDNHLNPPKIG